MGIKCKKAGMDITANPYRNYEGYVEHHQQWIEGLNYEK